MAHSRLTIGCDKSLWLTSHLGADLAHFKRFVDFIDVSKGMLSKWNIALGEGLEMACINRIACL
jgi:hypothetical protein